MFYFSSREREENISDLHLSRLRCDQMVSVKCKMKYLIFSVPPTISVLLDEKGAEVEGRVGPYNLGGTLILTCDILGGQSTVLDADPNTPDIYYVSFDK